MASAIIDGLEAAGLAANQITVVDLQAETRQRHEQAGRYATAEIGEALSRCSVLVLAVKPQVAPVVLRSIADQAASTQSLPLMISIMAGVRLRTLEDALTPSARVVRVMPNTPMAIGAGMSAITGGTHAQEIDLQITETICRSGGEVMRLPEDQFDAFTALAGSGPAFLFATVKSWSKPPWHKVSPQIKPTKLSVKQSKAPYATCAHSQIFQQHNSAKR